MARGGLEVSFYQNLEQDKWVLVISDAIDNFVEKKVCARMEQERRRLSHSLQVNQKPRVVRRLRRSTL